MTWRVILQASYATWEERDHPDEDRRIALLEWLADLVETGPPDDSLPVPFQPDLYVCRAAAADVLVSFLAMTYEQLIIVKEIASL